MKKNIQKTQPDPKKRRGNKQTYGKNKKKK
jgi:hypothetical protein